MECDIVLAATLLYSHMYVEVQVSHLVCVDSQGRKSGLLAAAVMGATTPHVVFTDTTLSVDSLSLVVVNVPAPH